MSQWLPPLLFVGFGLLMHLLSALGIRRAQRPGYGDDWDPFRREQQARAMRSPYQERSVGTVGAALGVAAVVAFTGGSPSWWISALASVLFVALVPQTVRFRHATSGRLTLVLGATLMVVAFGALLGAGWSSAWVSRPKQDPA